MIIIIVLTGASCKQDSSIIQDFVPVKDNKINSSTVDNASIISDLSVDKTANLKRLQVINSKTKKAVPSAILVVPYSSVTFTADKDGFINVSKDYNTIYIPQMSSYYSSGEIDLSTSSFSQITKIEISPMPSIDGFEIVFLDSILESSSDGSTVIKGQVTKDGKYLADATIAVSQATGYNIKTDKNGKFEKTISDQNGGLRLYFPSVKNNKQYQIDVAKGYIISVLINL